MRFFVLYGRQNVAVCYLHHMSKPLGSIQSPTTIELGFEKLFEGAFKIAHSNADPARLEKAAEYLEVLATTMKVAALLGREDRGSSRFDVPFPE
jgi:hypothetical protein